MPQNKSHHFVPKFYLRNFSRTDRNIDLFNISSGRLIKGASIKGQCCRDYFYGKDLQTELSLAAAEGEVAKLFRLIFQSVRLPHRFSAGHVLLCFHIATQAFRTQHAADALNDSVDGMTRQVMKHHPEVTSEMLERVKFGYDDPALVATGFAARSFPLLMDLELGVVVAPRGSEFITGDNPIVMYNQFLQWRGLGSNTGVATKGLQIFFPLCPLLTLVLYDRGTYHFGRTKSAWVHAATAADVHELNVMQAVSATENVYLFRPAANIFEVAKSAAKFRNERRSVVRALPQGDNGGRGSELITLSQEDLCTDAELAFMRVHKKARTWLNELRRQRYQPAVILRDEAMVKKFEAHDKAVKEGRASAEDAIPSIFGRNVVDGTF